MVLVDKAHQRIIREKMQKEESYNLFGNWWDNINTNKDNAVIKRITRDTALPIILKYEWLGTLPVNFTKFCGLYFDGALAGVTCFVKTRVAGEYSLWNYPAICLGRGACVHWCPDWGGSYLIQKSLKLLFSNKEPMYVVAFSDWKAGEIGTIYQACNWIYLGHKNTKEWVDINNKSTSITPHTRIVTGFKRRKNPELRATKEQIKEEKQKMINEGYKLVAGPTRGKYATITGKKNKKYREMVGLLKKNSKPYPKRNNA